jgi:hypothetical protein
MIAGTVEKEEAATARQWHRKHVSAANKHMTIENDWKKHFLCSP